MDVFCLSSFLLSSQLISSLVSVVFDFNASLNDIAPVSPILLPVVMKRKERSDLLMDVFSVSSSLLSSHLRLSSVSVVFDFNASLNEVAPVSPILLSVDMKRKERMNCLRMSFVPFLVFTS